ncbi:MAG: xanthine dehydrogenase family protein molybdopterin-binding subunit [Tissierellia bacterium]|nr:xanthine dehydrogenase family protein molybdopterin-binding subunit [Tissierellia bacterium]
MHEISKPVKKKDHDEKISGEALYTDDIKDEGMLYGKIVRSEKAKARIINIKKPELPEDCYYIDYNDTAAINRTKVIMDDQPIFAEEIVNYVGEAIMMVVAPDYYMATDIAEQIIVEYEELDAITDFEKSDIIAHEYSYKFGNPDSAFSKADYIIEEVFRTGYQEQAYIEPQGMIAYYEGDKLCIDGSMQCPYYVQNAIKYAFGLEDDQVRIRQMYTGGGFGGKEDYPSVLACQTAIAAHKTKKKVKVVFRRREDMTVTTKRHPSRTIIKTAMSNDGEILGMDIDLIMNGGAYPGLSSVVLQRGLICAGGVYNIPNLKVRGAIVLSNTVPTGAFRGFGAPQALYAIESHMAHIAKKLGEEPVTFKQRHFVKTGDQTSTGGKFREPVMISDMLRKITAKSNYYEKYREYRNQKGRYRKGIGTSIFLHGCGFTGSAERDIIKSIIHVYKNRDGNIEIRVSNTDIGQGLKTTFSKIAANVLEIPLDRIEVVPADTSIVPDSGPTVASRSLMVVGRLIERACQKLKSRWDEEEVLIEERYRDEAEVIPWDMDRFCGDAYPTYSWGINIVELELDILTGMNKLLNVWGIYDVGTPADYLILKGQMEGGLLQGIGYGSMEKMESKDGILQQKSMSNYMIPTCLDTVNFDIEFIDNPYEFGPFGGKGAGEIPLDGGAPAYAMAIESAIGMDICKIPITPEYIIERLRGEE